MDRNEAKDKAPLGSNESAPRAQVDLGQYDAVPKDSNQGLNGVAFGCLIYVVTLFFILGVKSQTVPLILLLVAFLALFRRGTRFVGLGFLLGALLTYMIFTAICGSGFQGI